jgi:hypothetical protein
MKRFYSIFSIVLLSSICLINVASAQPPTNVEICPSVSDLNYNSGAIAPPDGWGVIKTPTCSDTTPVQWLMADWSTDSPAYPSKITCFYEVKGYKPNSGCGGWGIARTTTSPDPLADGARGAWFHDTYSYELCQPHNGAPSDCPFPVS